MAIYREESWNMGGYVLLHKLGFGPWMALEDFGGVGEDVEGFLDW